MALRRAISVSGAGVGGFAGTGTSSVSVSGGSSATASQYWLIFTQSVYGNWLRKWVFDVAPTELQGIFSGCPKIDYTVCEFDYCFQTKLVKEFNTYPGDLNVMQELQYISDHPKGGLGVSGTVWTDKQAYVRMKWNDNTHEEHSCFQCVGGIEGGKFTGPYSYGFPQDLMDTSGTISQAFSNTLENGSRFSCPNFNMGLVNL